MKLNIKLFNEEAIIPVRQNANDAWMDCYSYQDLIVQMWETVRIPLWFWIEIINDIPDNHEFGYMWLIQGRSWLAAKKWIDTFWNVIDEGYRWEVSCIIFNGWIEDFVIKKWDRICQLVLVPVIFPNTHLVNEFETGSTRWSNWIGSTGI